MSENYVSVEAFKGLEDRVEKLERTTEHSDKLLVAIDKKVDLISEKLMNADKTETLKLKPLEDRVSKLEQQQDWLWKTVAGAIIIAVLGLVIVGG